MLEDWISVAPWSWLAVASFFTGFSKAGVTGLAPLVTVIFATATPGGPKRALGLIQPVLAVSDAMVFCRYRAELKQKDGQMPNMDIKLVLWTLLGVFLGQASLGRFDDRAVRHVLAAVLWMLIVYKGLVNLIRVLPSFSGRIPCWVIGILCGLVSVLTNNAGVLVDMYLLSANFSKQEYLMRRSSLLCVIASVKLALHLCTGVLPIDITLLQAAFLCLLALAGVPAGQALARYIPQNMFGAVSWSLVMLGAIQLALA